MKKTKIGKTITYFRKNAGLTQKQLADKLCVSDKAVSKWERGLSYPDVTFISKLSKILDIDTDALFIEEDKHISENWCGLFYFPKGTSKIKLNNKVADKYVLDIILSYYLLVSINKIIIVCDGEDRVFVKKYIKKLECYDIRIVILSSREYRDISNINWLKNVTSIMLIYDLFFIYGVGLTSSFQRAMLENLKIMHITNPELPVIFGHKSDILKCISDINDMLEADSLKLFKGYMTINLKTDKDINKCEKLIKTIETYCGYELYDVNDIISIRGLV